MSGEEFKKIVINDLKSIGTAAKCFAIGVGRGAYSTIRPFSQCRKTFDFAVSDENRVMDDLFMVAGQLPTHIVSASYIFSYLSSQDMAIEGSIILGTSMIADYVHDTYKRNKKI